jgi:hypothetical protein
MFTKIFGWGSAALGFGASALGWWKVAAIGAVALAISHGFVGWRAYNAGWHNAENAYVAAIVKAQAAHTAWLLQTAQKSGAMSLGDSAIELSNEQIQKGIDDAIANLTDSALGACGSPGFLQHLAKLR